MNNTQTFEHVKYFIHIVYKLYPPGKHMNPKIDYFTVIHIFLNKLLLRLSSEHRGLQPALLISASSLASPALEELRFRGSQPCCRSLTPCMPMAGAGMSVNHEPCQFTVLIFVKRIYCRVCILIRQEKKRDWRCVRLLWAVRTFSAL